MTKLGKMRDSNKDKLNQRTGGGNRQKQQKSEVEQWTEGCEQQKEECTEEQSCEQRF
ncbi:MAG: hypothetical protein HPY50_18240 [Firmicutes bacterium]|nr:hypothetical protein [Bacillota bacterium]